MSVRRRLARLGLNRSMLVRRLVRLGHPRLRRLWSAARGGGIGGAVLGRPARWLARGKLTVPTGAAVGLQLSLAHLPLGHAHLGALAFGDLETSVQEAMRRHLVTGGVFYDLGANIGFFSLLAARLVGEGGRVLAFEPSPDNAQAIRVNAALNGLEGRIEVIAKAVGASNKTARLQVVDDQSWSKLEDYGPHPTTERVLDIEVVSLDALVGDGLPPPTVVKLDVEEAEIAALEGMREVLRVHRPAVICELHDTHRDFAELMRSIGYRVVNLESAEPIEEAGSSAHALALPEGHPGD